MCLTAEVRFRPSLDMSEGISSMGPLGARWPAEDSGSAGWTVRCAQAAVMRVHHILQVDAGVSECIDPFGCTRILSPIHIAPRRSLIDDLQTNCGVPQAAQSLTSKSSGSRSRSCRCRTLGALAPAVHASHIGLREPVSDRYRPTAPYRCRSVSELWRTSHCSGLCSLGSGCRTAPGRARMKNG